eukprot:scaffold16995_cov127-Isochrysis_galbana.AAC.13
MLGARIKRVASQTDEPHRIWMSDHENRARGLENSLDRPRDSYMQHSTHLTPSTSTFTYK